MGKSTTAGLFAERGAPVYDADAAVHALYGFGGAAVDAVEAAFPGVVAHGVVDRARLGARVLDDPEALQRLEAVVHPLVGAHRAHFFEAVAGAAVVVLDVPLLFETGGEAWMDAVAVVSCPPELQRARVLARPGMTPEKLEAVLARQTPDADKRARADFVIDTSQGLDAARAQVAAVLAAVTALGFRPRAPRDPCAPSPGAP